MNNQNNTGDVFISYRHNHIDLVNPVIEELERRKISYFIDKDGITHGDYTERISRAIENCNLFLFFWTIDSNESDDMKSEAGLAKDFHKKILLYKIGKFDVKTHRTLHYLFRFVHRYEVFTQTPKTVINVVDRVERALQDVKQSPLIESILQKAQQGDAEAQTNLGWRYIRGDGVPQDDKEAVKWFQKAADQGQKVAMAFLSLCYTNGDGVPKNPQKAKELWNKANVNGIAETRKRKNRNVRMFGAIAAPSTFKGVVSSVLGAMFSPIGWIIRGTAKECLCESRKFEISECCDILECDELYQMSDVPQDFTEAITRYQQAAELGDPKAQSFLGFCYANGAGVIKDVAEAIKWYQKAAQQGNKEAIKALKELK